MTQKWQVLAYWQQKRTAKLSKIVSQLNIAWLQISSSCHICQSWTKKHLLICQKRQTLSWKSTINQTSNNPSPWSSFLHAFLSQIAFLRGFALHAVNCIIRSSILIKLPFLELWIYIKSRAAFCFSSISWNTHNSTVISHTNVC